MERRRVAELLISGGYLSEEQVTEALRVLGSHSDGSELGPMLIERGLLTPRELAQVHGQQFHMEVVDLTRVHPEPLALKAVDRTLALRLGVLPLTVDGGVLTVAVSDPLDFGIPKALASESRMRVQIVLAPPDDIRVVLAHAYGEDASPDGAPPRLEALGRRPSELRLPHPHPGAPPPAPAPDRILRLLARARAEGARAIVLDPGPRGLAVRLRDGLGQRLLHTLPPAQAEGFVAELWGAFALGEGPEAQPARLSAQTLVDGVPMRVQIRSVETLLGLRVVLALEGSPSQAVPLARRPLTRRNLEGISTLLAAPGGGILPVFLRHGESGRGFLSGLGLALGLEGKTQILVEEGSPGLMEGFVQIAAGPELSLAEAVEAAALQDPDVILLSDLREGETLGAALAAALRGVKVFAGIRGATPSEGLETLLSLGEDPGALSRALLGLTLVWGLPRICSACRQESEPSEGALERLELKAFKGRFHLYEGGGCPLCDWGGSRGRVGLEAALTLDRGERAALARGEVPWALLDRMREALTYDAGAKALGGYVSGRDVLVALGACLG